MRSRDNSSKNLKYFFKKWTKKRKNNAIYENIKNTVKQSKFFIIFFQVKLPRDRILRSNKNTINSFFAAVISVEMKVNSEKNQCQCCRYILDKTKNFLKNILGIFSCHNKILSSCHQHYSNGICHGQLEQGSSHPEGDNGYAWYLFMHWATGLVNLLPKRAPAAQSSTNK